MSANSDFLGMSDEDFAKVQAPEVEPVIEPEPEPQPEETQPEPEETPNEETETPEEASEETPEEKPEEPKEETQEEEQPAPEAPKTYQEEPPKEEPKDETPEPPKTEGVDYEAFYKQVMAPFKANGKIIQLQSPEEVIQLMQQGANYTRKMQEIAKYRKYLMMLENNGMLDENKLSLYIDLDKGNKEAIKKYLKDKNLDPLEMDISGEVNYQSGAHAVTDQEAQLSAVISELKEMPGGQETLQSVQAWDTVSKQILFNNPNVLSVIHTQRENGIYEQISTEIERRKMLGQIDPNMPFLHAYKTVGDELFATKPAPSNPPPVTVRAPVAVRPAKTPATKVTDNSKVRAAASPRSTTRTAQSSINLLAMSDEEFLKKFADKV